MTKKQFNAPLYVVQYANTIIAAFATGVAALAFHKKNNRIYYTPMCINQLRYIDYPADRGFSGQSQKSSDQGNIIPDDVC